MSHHRRLVSCSHILEFVCYIKFNVFFTKKNLVFKQLQDLEVKVVSLETVKVNVLWNDMLLQPRILHQEMLSPDP